MQQRGFTLIEMLIALLIGVIIMLIVGTTYQAVTIGGLRADTSVSLQNGTRNTFDLMTSDAAAAGFMLYGLAGISRCGTLLTYNASLPAAVQSRQIYPVVDTPQGAQRYIPGTDIPLDYTSAAATPTDALTFAYNNAFGNSGALGTNGVQVTQVTPGTDTSASLFVSSSAGFQAKDIGLLVLPTLNSCIRMQITSIGGADNLIHNSGESPLNPSKGFSYFNNRLPRAITQSDLAQALVQNMGGSASVDGQIEVTYSIRNFNGMPTLFRTVVNGSGQVMQDSGIAANVVYIRAQFAPLNADGSIGTFVPWNDIPAAQRSKIGAIEFAVLMQSNNVGQRQDVPASIRVLDVNYPTDPKFEYEVFSRIVYLRNVAWSSQ